MGSTLEDLSCNALTNIDGLRNLRRLEELQPGMEVVTPCQILNLKRPYSTSIRAWNQDSIKSFQVAVAPGAMDAVKLFFKATDLAERVP